MSGVTSTSSFQSTFSIDGLGSGLSTSSIVDQLMAIEARPQQLTQLRLNSFQKSADAYDSVRSSLLNLRTAAQKLSTGLDWQPVSAVSSDATIASVTGTNALATGSLTFVVNTVARAAVLTSSGSISGSGVAVTPPGGGGANEVTVTVGSTAHTIDVGDGTLDSVINAINNAEVGVSATKIKVGDDAYRLQLTSNDPGTANAVSIASGDAGRFDGIGGGFLVTAAAADTSITIGTGPNAYNVTSSSTAITDLLPGTTINVLKPGTVTVSTTRNASGLADNVQALVTAYNASIASMKGVASYDPSTKVGGPLAGDSTIRSIQSSLPTAFTGSDGALSPSQAGLSLARDGTITFDRSVFLSAMSTDPVAVQKLFVDDPTAPGLAARLADTIALATDPVSGSLVSARNASTRTVADLQTSIASMQVRLDARRESLRQQFTAMESALSQLKSQGSWLASQVSSLNGGSSA